MILYFDCLSLHSFPILSFPPLSYLIFPIRHPFPVHPGLASSHYKQRNWGPGILNTSNNSYRAKGETWFLKCLSENSGKCLMESKSPIKYVNHCSLCISQCSQYQWGLREENQEWSFSETVWTMTVFSKDFISRHYCKKSRNLLVMEMVCLWF